MNNKDLDKILSDRLDKWEEEAKTAIKWITVDPDGAVWGHSTKPKIGLFEGFWGCVQIVFIWATLMTNTCARTGTKLLEK